MRFRDDEPTVGEMLLVFRAGGARDDWAKLDAMVELIARRAAPPVARATVEAWRFDEFRRAMTEMIEQLQAAGGGMAEAERVRDLFRAAAREAQQRERPH